MGQVSDGRRHDVPAPSVLEGHCDSQRNAKIPCLTGPGQASELADLDVDHVHGKILLALENLRDSVDRFVHHEGQVGVPAYGQTILVAQAGLLDIDVDVFDRAHDAHGLVLEPSGVRVRDQFVTRLQNGGHLADTLDIDVRIASDLQLKAAVSFFPVAGHVLGHFFRALLRNRPVKYEIVPVGASQ